MPTVRGSPTFEKLLSALDDPRITDGPELQIALAERTREISHMLSAEERTVFYDRFGETIGRTADWVRTVLGLSRPDLRRAFYARPAPLQRLADEMLYPEDGWLGAYLLWTQETESPLGWHFWAGVVLLSLVARRNFYWDRGRYFLFLNHYVFLLGESGLRKSTTYEQAMEVYDRMLEIASAGQAFPVDPIYRTPQRITPERMLADLSRWATNDPTNNRKDTIVFVPSDELAGLLGRDIKGSDRLANLLTEVYGGKRTYQDSTLTGGDRKLTNLQVSCLFASTPDSVRRAITESMFTEGLMGRVVTVKRDTPHGYYDTPPPSDPVQCTLLAEALVPWLQIAEEVELRMSEDARKWFKDWYVETHRAHRPDDPKVRSFWSRKHDHLLRLAGVLQLSQLIGCPRDVLDETVRRGLVIVDMPVIAKALAILEDEERRLPEAFADVGADDEARKLWKLEAYITTWYRDKKVPIPHSVLLRNTLSYNGGALGMKLMIETLIGSGVIEIPKENRGPKVGTAYRPVKPVVEEVDQPDPPEVT